MEIKILSISATTKTPVMGIPTGILEVLLPQDDLIVVELLNFSVSIGKYYYN